MRQAHAQYRVTRLERGEEHGLVGLCAGMRLHVGGLRVEQLLRAFERDALRDVDVFAATVVALARIALGVLVRQLRALRRHDRGTGVVFRRDQLDVVFLPLVFSGNGIPQLGIGIGKRSGAGEHGEGIARVGKGHFSIGMAGAATTDRPRRPRFRRAFAFIPLIIPATLRGRPAPGIRAVSTNGRCPEWIQGNRIRRMPFGGSVKALLSLSHAIDKLNERIGLTVSWLVLAAVLISAANAVVRKAFNVSSNSFLEIQWYLFSVVFLFCAGYTLLQNQHVRIDVIAGRLSPRTQAWIDILGTIFFLLPMALTIMWLSWPVFIEAYAAARSLDQCRRPYHLAGAAAGSDRILPARHPGHLRTDQAHRVPQGAHSGSGAEAARKERRRGAGRGHPARAAAGREEA